jgi:ribonuclease Z
MIDVCLLGTGGTLPLPGRYLASALIRLGGRLILIDCGEGTQVSLRSVGWGIKDIGVIALTHFHADHVSGLPGLLLTIGNSGRTREEPLMIVGPKNTRRVVESLRVIAPSLPYPVQYTEWTGDEDEALEVGAGLLSAAPADHDIPCLSYRLDLPRAPMFQPEKAKSLGVPLPLWKVLQRGEAVAFEGRTVQPEEVLGPPRPGLSVAYITDSRPTQRLVEFVTDVDLLISEATYGDPADRPKAVENKHMTFSESATLASAARAKRLWFTHFSPALPFPLNYREEAEAIYPSVVIPRDHHEDTLKFAD